MEDIEDKKESICKEYKNVINNLRKEKKYKECFSVLQKLNERNYYPDVLQDLIKYITELNFNNEKEKIKKIYSDVYEKIPDAFLREKNIFLNEYEISQGITELKSYPIFFQIILTRKCNLRCIMCGVPHDNLNYSLTDKEIDEIIEIIPYLNVLTLQGGEVFFDQRINKILDAARKNNVCTKIITNGILLNENIIEKLVNMNINLIISIDSCNKQNYEQIRVGAKFDKLIDNINLLNEYKSKYKSNINLTLAMVVMKRNYKEIEDIIHFANKYNFSEITLSQIYGNLAGDQQNFFDFDVDLNIIKELDEKRILFDDLAKKYSIALYNKLPRFSDYNIKNKESDFDVNLKKELYEKKEDSIKIDKELITSDNEKEINNITEFNIHPLFCYKPFKSLFIDDYNFYPYCICAHTDNTINDSRNIAFKDSKNNSILNRWNSRYMQNYRYKMFCKRQADICTSRCLRTEYISSI